MSSTVVPPCFGSGPAAVNTVATATGANGKAVKNWFRGRNAPSARFLSVLGRQRYDWLFRYDVDTVAI